jgi:hypothetical protein
LISEVFVDYEKAKETAKKLKEHYAKETVLEIYNDLPNLADCYIELKARMDGLEK